MCKGVIVPKMCRLKFFTPLSTNFQRGGGRIFFIFPLFLTCSFQVPNGFPAGSEYVPYVPKILPLPLALTKNDDEQFWKEQFQAANGRLSMHS